MVAVKRETVKNSFEKKMADTQSAVLTYYTATITVLVINICYVFTQVYTLSQPTQANLFTKLKFLV